MDIESRKIVDVALMTEIKSRFGLC